METTIREAEIGDSDLVNRLYDGLDQQHSDELPSLFRRTADTPRNREYFASILADEKAAILVAICDCLAGFIHVRLSGSPSFPIFTPQLRTIVDALFVDPGYRRKGVATRLMKAAEAWGKRHGASGIELSVYEFNREAQAFFSATGYRTLKRGLSKPLE